MYFVVVVTMEREKMFKCVSVNRNDVLRSHSWKRIFVFLTRLSEAETDAILSERQEPKRVGHVRLSKRIED